MDVFHVLMHLVNTGVFAKTDENGKVIDVREKVKISDNASVGAYYFKSAAEYIRIYEEYYKNDSNIEKGEKYIAQCIISL